MESEKLKEINAGEPNRPSPSAEPAPQQQNPWRPDPGRGGRGTKRKDENPSEQGRGCTAPFCCLSLKGRSVIHVWISDQ
jgi:hypothetical protein